MSRITQALTKLKNKQFDLKLIGIVRKRKWYYKRQVEIAIVAPSKSDVFIQEDKRLQEAAIITPTESERLHFSLSWEQEKQLIDSLKEKARQGDIVTGIEIKEAYEKLCGFYVGKVRIFRIMQEHGWFDVVPPRSH